MERFRNGQRGYVGVIVLLVALAIVAWLASDALVKYGLLPGGPIKGERAATPAERGRIEAGGAAERVDATTAIPAPAAAIEKARALEETLRRASEQRGGSQ